MCKPQIDAIYEKALDAGAAGGKISGAGGGGFMFFYCPDDTRYAVTVQLRALDGLVQPYEFTKEGLYSYTIL